MLCATPAVVLPILSPLFHVGGCNWETVSLKHSDRSATRDFFFFFLMV